MELLWTPRPLPAAPGTNTAAGASIRVKLEGGNQGRKSFAESKAGDGAVRLGFSGRYHQAESDPR